MKRISSINCLYPPFAEKINISLKIANENKIPLKLFETYRSPARQQYLYDKGRKSPGRIVTMAPPWKSWHNYGIAADLVLYIDKKWTWEYEDLYRKAGPIFEQQGLKWLGRSSRFPELVHYQIEDKHTLSEAETIVRNEGLLGYWFTLDKFFNR